MLISFGRAGFWMGCLMVAMVSYRFFLAPLAVVMDHMAHYLTLAPWALYGHIVLAPLALALAPFQLWQGLRASQPRLHRAVGYTYALSVLIAGLASLSLLPHFKGEWHSALGFGLLAVFWIGATARGVWLARAGNYTRHRQWMTRSVALTFAAVTLRLIMAPLMAMGWSVTETYQITAWASWLLTLAFAELWLRRGVKIQRAPGLATGRP